MTSRHIQMIAVGGCIGSGLFIGSGFALSQGGTKILNTMFYCLTGLISYKKIMHFNIGPGNLLAGFITIGAMIFCMMQALGELCILYPVKGAFASFSTQFIHPAWGFAMTWNYTLQWWAVLPLEISAASITIQYWWPEANLPGFVTLFLFLVIVLNLFGVRG